MQNKKTFILAFSGLAIAINIVLGIITNALGIPLYLDTLGTVLVAALFGLWPGVIVGALTNIITGLIYSVTDIPFALVSVAIAIVVALIAKRWGFGFGVALVTGLILSIVAPVIGTPIGIYVYGGLNGTFSDVFVTGLVQAGQTVFSASFIRNIASNLIDKIGTALIVAALIRVLPMSVMQYADNLKDTRLEHVES